MGCAPYCGFNVRTYSQAISNEPNSYTRGKAVVALFYSGREKVVPDLLALLDNDERGKHFHDKSLAEYAAQFLMELKSPAIEDWGIQQLNREDARQKRIALQFLMT